jgi:hypothetical protein
MPRYLQPHCLRESVFNINSRFFTTMKGASDYKQLFFVRGKNDIDVNYG